MTLRSRSQILKFYVWVFFWLKFLEVYIFWSFSWILLILGLIVDTGLDFMLHHPHPLIVLEVKVTDFEILR